MMRASPEFTELQQAMALQLELSANRSRPAKPRPDSVKLKPEFKRKMHLGPVSEPQVRKLLGVNADLIYRTGRAGRAE